MTTMQRPARRVKPRNAPDCFVLVEKPICPCEMLPAGLPGVALLNGHEYRVEINADLPAIGEPQVHGYRLTNPDGDTYDVPADLSSCECLGHLRWSQDRGTVCKHRRALAHFFGVAS